MSKLKEGSKAPDFVLSASNGKKVKLSSFKGKKNIVLYFYPKDLTPGCTIEACDFRDSKRKLDRKSVEVLGVSFDSLNLHNRFIDKHNLPFLLLSDEEKIVAKKYGVYKKKSLYGRSYMGIERTTFVIDKNQKIKKIFSKVKVKRHAEEVLTVTKLL
jgi:thioredoxin-dependent peroxiredoxin